MIISFYWKTVSKRMCTIDFTWGYMYLKDIHKNVNCGQLQCYITQVVLCKTVLELCNGAEQISFTREPSLWVRRTSFRSSTKARGRGIYGIKTEEAGPFGAHGGGERWLEKVCSNLPSAGTLTSCRPPHYCEKWRSLAPFLRSGVFCPLISKGHRLYACPKPGPIQS